MWPASQAQQLAHFERSIDFAEERWTELEAASAQTGEVLAVNFAQAKPEGAQ